MSISDHENVCSVVPASHMICLDDSAVQSISNGFENMPARNILAHVEFRDSLPPDSHISVALKGNMEAAFTIDKARNLMIIQHFDLSC